MNVIMHDGTIRTDESTKVKQYKRKKAQIVHLFPTLSRASESPTYTQSV